MNNKENITSIKTDNHSGDSSDLPTIPALDLRPEDCALLAELKNLTIKRTFDVTKLPLKVTKHVLYLKDIQVKHELEEKFLAEITALETKYDNLYKPLFVKRYEIVNGEVEAETEKEGVPNFWLIAMKTNEMLANEITERDEGALSISKTSDVAELKTIQEISNWSFSLTLILTLKTQSCLKLTM